MAIDPDRLRKLRPSVRIIFGGTGDGGGIAITPSGKIVKIPPYDPPIAARIREMLDLAQADDQQADRLAEDLAPEMFRHVDAHLDLDADIDLDADFGAEQRGGRLSS